MQHLGSGSSGVWTRQQARAVVTRRGLEAQVYDGSWREVYPRTFTDGGHAMTPVQRAHAGAVASGAKDVPSLLDCESPALLGALACGRCAARVWGMPLIDDDDPATGALDKQHHDVAVFRNVGGDLRSRPVGPEDPVDVLHRHQLWLARADVVRHPSGLWLTVPRRTLYDLTSLLTPTAHVAAIDWAMHQGMVSRADLAELAVLHKGWRHTPAFLRALELADELSESPLESVTRLLLKPAWPALRSQVVVRDAGDVPVARYDLGDEDLRLGVNCDGKRWHAGEVSRASDHRRDSLAAASGWRGEPVTWYDVRARPQPTLTRLLAARWARAQELAERRRAA